MRVESVWVSLEAWGPKLVPPTSPRSLPSQSEGLVVSSVSASVMRGEGVLMRCGMSIYIGIVIAYFVSKYIVPTGFGPS